MANNGSKYHGEIKVAIGTNEARVNVFADTLNELFRDLGIIQAQFGFADPVTNPGKRDIINAERKASQVLGRNGQPLAPPSQPNGVQTQVPVCVHCGSSQRMELIEFTSKKDGQLKRAWKCQECEEWHFPDSAKKKR